MLALAFHEIAVLLRAGVTLDQALDGASHTGPAHFRQALRQLAQGVANGVPLSEGLRGYPVLFHPVIPAIIASGEQTGGLDGSFELLAEFFEAEAQIRRTIQSALVYPVIVVVTAILAVAILAYIGFMPGDWAVRLAWGVGIIAALWLALRLRSIQQLARYFVMGLPFFGALMQQLAVSRFCYTFGLLIRAGVPFLEGLETTRPVVQHPLVERAVGFVYASVRNGNTVEDSLRGEHVFPPVVHNLVGSGEMAGSLDTALLKAAEYLRRDAEYKIKNSSKFAGPVAIVVLGIIVLLILVTFWSNYFSNIMGILEE